MSSGFAGIRGKIAVYAAGLGAAGLFAVSFLDSSVLTFPVINDLLLVDLSIKHPARMPYYALMTTLGSVAGCVVLYLLVRKGGEALFHRQAGRHSAAIRHWMETNGFFGVLIAALLPPPTPFKVFVFAAAIFEVPLASFAAAVTLARLIRYFGIGYLAVRYGAEALPYLAKHRIQAAAVILALVLLSYLFSRIFLRRHDVKQGSPQS